MATRVRREPGVCISASANLHEFGCGGEAQFVAPLTPCRFTVTVGTHLYGVVRSRRKVGKHIRISRHCDSVGFVTVHTDLPLGGRAIFGPAQLSAVQGDVGDHKIRGRRRVDGQVKRIHLRTAVGILVTVRVVTGNGISLAVAVRPDVGAAVFNRNCGMHRLVDGEMQGYKRVAACSVGRKVRIISRLRVEGAVPDETLASHSGGVAGGGLVDGQMQRYDRVAACNVGRLVLIVAGCRVILAMPDKTLASHSSGIAGRRRVHSQHHRHEAVAAVGSDHGYCLCACSVEGHAVPDNRQFAGADRSIFCDFKCSAHQQGHRHHTVAAVGSG